MFSTVLDCNGCYGNRNVCDEMDCFAWILLYSRLKLWKKGNMIRSSCIFNIFEIFPRW